MLSTQESMEVGTSPVPEPVVQSAVPSANLDQEGTTMAEDQSWEPWYDVGPKGRPCKPTPQPDESVDSAAAAATAVGAAAEQSSGSVGPSATAVATVPERLVVQCDGAEGFKDPTTFVTSFPGIFRRYDSRHPVYVAPWAVPVTAFVGDAAERQMKNFVQNRCWGVHWPPLYKEQSRQLHSWPGLLFGPAHGRDSTLLLLEPASWDSFDGPNLVDGQLDESLIKGSDNMYFRVQRRMHQVKFHKRIFNVFGELVSAFDSDGKMAFVTSNGDPPISWSCIQYVEVVTKRKIDCYSPNERSRRIVERWHRTINSTQTKYHSYGKREFAEQVIWAGPGRDDWRIQTVYDQRSGRMLDSKEYFSWADRQGWMSDLAPLGSWLWWQLVGEQRIETSTALPFQPMTFSPVAFNQWGHADVEMVQWVQKRCEQHPDWRGNNNPWTQSTWVEGWDHNARKKYLQTLEPWKSWNEAHQAKLNAATAAAANKAAQAAKNGTQQG